MKVEIQNYHKSINQSSFTLAQVAMIWDFYVTNSIESKPSANDKKDDHTSKVRTVKSYGWDKLPWDDMLRVAGITEENIKILFADSMPNTLKRLDLNVAGKKEQALPSTLICLELLACAFTELLMTVDLPLKRAVKHKLYCDILEIRLLMNVLIFLIMAMSCLKIKMIIPMLLQHA